MSMTPSPIRPYASTLRSYFLGQACILGGACLMDITGSFLPMALGASAGLMLTAPLIKQIYARARARSAAS